MQSGPRRNTKASVPILSLSHAIPCLVGMGMAALTMGQNLGMVAGPAIFGPIAGQVSWTTGRPEPAAHFASGLHPRPPGTRLLTRDDAHHRSGSMVTAAIKALPNARPLMMYSTTRKP